MRVLMADMIGVNLVGCGEFVPIWARDGTVWKTNSLNTVTGWPQGPYC